MGNPGHIKEAIVTYLRQHRGMPVTVQELALGIGVTRQQVFNAMTYIVRTMHPLIRKIASGVYIMGSENDGEGVRLVFDLVAEQDGVMLVKDSDGKLLKLVAVNL